MSKATVGERMRLKISTGVNKSAGKLVKLLHAGSVSHFFANTAS